MDAAKETTHLITPGFTSAKLIASTRLHPAHKVIIVTLKGDENIDRVGQTIQQLYDAFKGIEIEETIVERENVFQTTLDILGIIEKEMKNGKVVKINISGGMRNIGISAYIASLVSKIVIYTDIPDSKNDEVYKLKNILEIPPIPIKEIPREQIQILQVLSGGVDSLDILISRLKPQLEKGTKEYNNERSRVSHHIKKLKIDGFIETKKDKKFVSVKKTILADIYIKGMEIAALS